MSDSEIKLFYAQSSEVKNRILAQDEHLRAIDTGEYYVAGPDGKPQAVLTASNSDSGVVITVGPGDSEDLIRAVRQGATSPKLPARPAATVVHWYSHDIPAVSMLYPFDQHFPSGVLALYARGQDGAVFDASNTAAVLNAGGSGVLAGAITKLLDKSERLNHAVSSGGSRPLLSGRVNLLPTTETLAGWLKSFGGTGQVPVVTPSAGFAPDGTNSAIKVDFNCANLSTSTNRSYISASHTSASGTTYRARLWIKAATAADVGKTLRVINENSVSHAATIVTIPDDWTLIDRTVVRSATGTNTNWFLETRGTMTSDSAASVLIWHPDLRLAGSDVGIPAYQRVVDDSDYDVSLFPIGAKFDGADDYAAAVGGGGATSAFLWAGSICLDAIGVAQTLFSDAGANTGYRVRITSANFVEFSAGNGSAYTAVTSAAALSRGDRVAIMVWHDGTNLNLQIGDNAIVTAAFATASAGTAGITVGKDNGATSGYFGGQLYTALHFKDTSLTPTARDAVKAYVKGKAYLA